VEWITSAEGWAALLTLTVLEIVLGIDNIIFIAILAGKLPPAQRDRARRTGLFLAMFIRIALLMSIVWVMSLTRPFLTIFGFPLSGRSLILAGGGLFLIYKSTREIHENLEGADTDHTPRRAAVSFAGIIVQILLLDIVFSLDSVITAVGMAEYVTIMVAAIVIAVGCMLFASAALATFVERHPTIKMLALSFLLLIGLSLIAEGFGQHVPKGYIYFAMGFSVFVEMVNLRMRAKSKEAGVHLRRTLPDD
jgi:predicted tellurium resistance membrane protein TerC